MGQPAKVAVEAAPPMLRASSLRYSCPNKVHLRDRLLARKARRLQTTRLLFLRVGALSSERLPPWKRSHMDSELSVQYSAILSDAIAPYGWRMLDTFSSGASHPEESPDGVHYPGRISHYHTHLMLNAICES